MNCVPGGAFSMKYDRDPRTTRPARTTLAVISPRSPGPSGLHARLHVIPRHRVAVLEAQHVLQQHLDRLGEAGHVEFLLQRVEAKDLVVASG